MELLKLNTLLFYLILIKFRMEKLEIRVNFAGSSLHETRDASAPVRQNGHRTRISSFLKMKF